MELNPVTSLEWLDWDIISRLGVAAILGLVLGSIASGAAMPLACERMA